MGAEKKRRKRFTRERETEEDAGRKAIVARFALRVPSINFQINRRPKVAAAAPPHRVFPRTERSGARFRIQPRRREDYRRLKSRFPSKFHARPRQTRLTSPSALPVPTPVNPPRATPTIFTFTRRAGRKSIHLRAKSSTRNRFSQSYAAGEFPTTIPPGCLGSPLPSPPPHRSAASSSRTPPADGGPRHVLEKRRRHRWRWRRNIATVSSYRSRFPRVGPRRGGEEKRENTRRSRGRGRGRAPSP